jgi:hypothetical protein
MQVQHVAEKNRKKRTGLLLALSPFLFLGKAMTTERRRHIGSYPAGRRDAGAGRSVLARKGGTLERGRTREGGRAGVNDSERRRENKRERARAERGKGNRHSNRKTASKRTASRARFCQLLVAGCWLLAAGCWLPLLLLLLL